jgi:hypothetical protein
MNYKPGCGQLGAAKERESHVVAESKREWLTKGLALATRIEFLFLENILVCRRGTK